MAPSRGWTAPCTRRSRRATTLWCCLPCTGCAPSRTRHRWCSTAAGSDSSWRCEMDTIEQALADIAAGRPVVVVDGEDRENEGDLIVAADLVDTATMAFVVRHTSGF